MITELQNQLKMERETLAKCREKMAHMATVETRARIWILLRAIRNNESDEFDEMLGQFNERLGQWMRKCLANGAQSFSVETSENGEKTIRCETNKGWENYGI